MSTDGDEYVPMMARWRLAASVAWQAVDPDGNIICTIKLDRFTADRTV